MTKIWNEAFWKDAPEERPVSSVIEPIWPLVLPVVVLAALTVVIGLAPQSLFAIADRAAVELLDLETYRTVIGLGGGGQ
jgi:multicomponent Na+:H+ antiporter subunit D